VYHRDDAQIVFLDTPGIHEAKDVFNKRIVEVAVSSVNDADFVLFLSDMKNPEPRTEKTILDIIKSSGKPAILALNKIDLVKNPQIAEIVELRKKTYPFVKTVPISAKSGEGIRELVDALLENLPTGPPFFPEDTLTDASLRFLAAEIVREKIFRLTGQEIPYSTAVTIDKFEEKESIVEIFATIHVERDSQKGILIGKGGAMLKKIGETARLDIEKLLESHVFLKLFVRVEKNWSKDSKALKKFGY
jgi:GTPase